MQPIPHCLGFLCYIAEAVLRFDEPRAYEDVSDWLRVLQDIGNDAMTLLQPGPPVAYTFNNFAGLMRRNHNEYVSTHIVSVPPEIAAMLFTGGSDLVGIAALGKRISRNISRVVSQQTGF